MAARHDETRRNAGQSANRQSGRRDFMRIGASTFIWVSPFSSDTLELIDKVKAFGFDLIEICVEDPDTIDTAVIGRALKRAGLGVTVCGAFGPNRDMSSDDPAVRDNAIGYSRRCADTAAARAAHSLRAQGATSAAQTLPREPSEAGRVNSPHRRPHPQAGGCPAVVRR